MKYDGLDIHRVRDLYFPVQGTGRGVQGELIASWMMTDAFSVGVGGRYWSMWTDYAAQTTDPANLFPVETDRYGVFLQAMNLLVDVLYGVADPRIRFDG